MKKISFFVGTIITVFLELMMISITSATTIVTPLTGEIVNYTLNESEIYTASVISVSDGNDTITILDRNLGATEAGMGCEGRSCSNGHPVYGYHFQWGNNYGFKGTGNLPQEQMSSAQVSASSIIYDPLQQQYYSSSTFIKWSVNWLNDNSKVDLWGGSVDDNTYDLSNDTWQVNNPTDRRGPCPENFHVPSLGEWDKMKNMMGNNVNEIHNKLKIPFASLRDNGGQGVYNLGSHAFLWSSSPYSVNEPDSRSFNMVAGDSTDIITGGRADARSIRCFYDFYLPYQQNSTTGDQQNTTGDQQNTTGNQQNLTGDQQSNDMYVHVIVEGGNLTIGIGSGNGDLEKNLGTIGISNTAQEVSGSFGTGYFRVEDMKGLESGYYTTLSVTDLIGENNENHIISGENVYFTPSGLTVISSGSASVVDSQVVIGSGNARNDWRSPSESPITYINRMNTPMSDAGRLGRRGDNLQVKVNIPANTLMDTYRGTITYTLFDCTEIDC